MTHSVHVGTGKPYDVLIGAGILPDTGKIIRGLGGKYTKAAVITDDNVAPLYLGTVKQSLEESGCGVEELIFPNGEASKCMDTAMDVISHLCERGVTRNDVIIALGGGVVGDLAGFAASIYQRGMDYIQIPTTVLAAVDSSVGGKTAVNIPQGKNLVGAFHQPVSVICDTDTLSTLSEDIFADGVAEIIKYGCIWDSELFGRIERGELKESLDSVIKRCVEIKAEVVSQDEYDNGLRQILNYGHTIGHAIEKLSGFDISHGKAVAIGMAVVSEAGERAGLTEPGTTKRIKSVLDSCGLPYETQYPMESICGACMGDKKRNGGVINFIFLKGIGECFIKPVGVDSVEEFFV